MAKRKHPYRPEKARISRTRAGAGRRHAGGPATPSESGKNRAPQAKDRRRRRDAGETVWIFGVHAVLAALANPDRVCHRLLVASADRSLLDDIADARGRVPGRPEVEAVDRADIAKVLGEDSVHQSVALLAGPLAKRTIEDVIKACDGVDDAAIVVLDQATDPRNVGAVLRSAAAFGVAAVVVQDRHTPTMTGALCKAASGAAERVPLARVANVARAIWALKDAGFWIVGLDPAADATLADAGLGGRAAIVVGAEGRGLRRLTRETCDRLLRVPVAAGTDSLNLSNAAAVAFYELRRRPR